MKGCELAFFNHYTYLLITITVTVSRAGSSEFGTAERGS